MTSAGKSADESAFLNQLGVRVRRARSRAGLTRRRLAERSGVSERYLAQLESGNGNISILLMIAGYSALLASDAWRQSQRALARCAEAPTLELEAGRA